MSWSGQWTTKPGLTKEEIISGIESMKFVGQETDDALEQQACAKDAAIALLSCGNLTDTPELFGFGISLSGHLNQNGDAVGNSISVNLYVASRVETETDQTPEPTLA